MDAVRWQRRTVLGIVALLGLVALELLVLTATVPHAPAWVFWIR